METENIILINEERIQANEINLNMKEWKTTIEECRSFFKNKTVMHFSDYVTKYDIEIKHKKEKGEITIICVLVNIPYQARKINDEKFIFWDVSDLKETQCRLFLTGEACEKYENEKEGVVVALINPFMKDKDPQYYDSRMLEVSKNEQIKVIGCIDGLGKCKGKTRKGLNCKIIVYVPLNGYYCKYHVKQDRKTKNKKKKVNKNAEEKTNDFVEEIIAYEEDNTLKEEKKKKAKNEKKEKATEDKNTEKNVNLQKDSNNLQKTDEYFDVDSIIGMFTKKEGKDKKKKAEMVNNRIKELDDYVKLHNPINAFENYIMDINEKGASTQQNESTGETEIPPKNNDVITTQCPELLHLIKKTNVEYNKENEEKTKTEDIQKEKESYLSLEEKQKIRFENFLRKLTELYKLRDEGSSKILVKGLVYTTNNFNFQLKHIENSNILDICYKLMDHKSEEVAIAALRFKRRINKEYINYYKNKKKQKNESRETSLSSMQQDRNKEVDVKEIVEEKS